MIDAIVRDVRVAARGLARNPGFAAAAVLTVALGMGATTAVFSVVYGVMFRPLPFPNANRLVQIVQVKLPTRDRLDPYRGGFTPEQIQALRTSARSVSRVSFAVDVDLRDEAIRDRRQALWMFQAGVTLILLIACVNVDNLLQTRAAQKCSEVRPAKLLSSPMREGLEVTAFGIALGLGGALLTTRFLETLLFGVTPMDSATFGGVAVLFVAIGALACYLPERRATRVDPVIALRAE